MGVLGLYQDGKKVDKISFPKTKPGESSTISIIIKNQAFNYCQIEGVSIYDDKVKVEGVPQGLEPSREAKIAITWSPELGTIRPLNTRIEFEETVG